MKVAQMYYGNQVYRTANKYNLHLISLEDCDNNGFPILEPVNHQVESLVAFSDMMQSDNFRAGIHFFKDDYRFERFWNIPEKYLPILSRFDCVLTPDFSTYADMPRPMQIWNVYRNRALGRYMQKQGLTVVPSLSWSTEDSYSWCFDGLPKESTLAVSTVGCGKIKAAQLGFQKGLTAALERLNPSNLIVYGNKFDFDFGKTKTTFITAKGGANGRSWR